VHGFADAATRYFGKPGTAANRTRVERIHRVLVGELKPVSLLDADYTGRTHGTLPEEALIALLRAITNARPE
jgi:hypothetical protein